MSVSVNIKALLIAIVFLAAGYVIAGGALPVAAAGSSQACKTVCEELPLTPAAEYGFTRKVDGADHCFCLQKQTIYNFDREKTLSWTQAFDIGVVTSADVENSIPADVKAQREEQVKQQQELLQRLQQQQSG